MTAEALKRKLDALPDTPGCYLFRDRRGRIIYVGKAVSLRKRVKSYFRAAVRRNAPPRLRSLVNSVVDLDTLPARTEADALLLETRLIKDYRPRFNVVFRDDKQYLSIRADSRETLPRLRTSRLVREDGAAYFGPFTSSLDARRIVDWLERRFGLRRCTPLRPDETTYRHCHNDIIRFCLAPCVGRISAFDYRARFEEACSVLRGHHVGVLNEIEADMRKAAESRDFEHAAALRDTLLALRFLMRRRTRMPQPRPRERMEAGLADLQRSLGLSSFPRRIEGFDISTIAGELAVASLVCAENGVPRPQWYRRYRIRMTGGMDDPRMIAEAVDRRYRRRLAEGRPPPDLVLVDGGVTQQRAARAALDALSLDSVPVIGLAKRFEEVIPNAPHAPPVRFASDAPALHVLQRLRDEAHRFALDYHHRLRKRRVRESALDEIPGIGPARKKNLLRHFGSVERLRRVSENELAILPGIGPVLARAILQVVNAGPFRESAAP